MASAMAIRLDFTSGAITTSDVRSTRAHHAHGRENFREPNHRPRPWRWPHAWTFEPTTILDP